MANLSQDLLNPDPWSGLIMGNHALARAMIEAGTRVITTFPGSPTPEIAQALTAVPKEKRPYYFEYSLNEKVALEVAAGASLNGHLSTVFFKSVGLNVASDSLIQLSLFELIGGMVIILGDDPGVNSSQNEQDNRHFSRMSYIPMFEPATAQEAYEMYIEAAGLSRRFKAPVCVRTTTHVSHAKEVVRFGPIKAGEADWTPRFDVANGPYLPLVQQVFPLKRKALKKLAEFERCSQESRFNAVLSPNGSAKSKGERFGIISASLPALSLLENLCESGEPIDLLKLGMSYPLPRRRIADFLKEHKEVLVVEELDRVMETEIKAIAFEEGARCTIHSRRDVEDLMGELGLDRTHRILALTWPWLFEMRDKLSPGNETIPRLAQMCPGCGHRSAFHAVKKAMEDNAITVGDIGCHSLGFFPPYNIGQVLLCMGHSTATAAGLRIGNTSRKVLCFLGDATLFHAGLPGIINAVVNDHDITLIVMENGTTAMTGHQPRPGSGEVGDEIPIGKLLDSLGVKFIREADTYQQSELTALVKEAMDHKGFSVVIARHPCMLKFTRERRAKSPGFKPTQVRVDRKTCNLSKVCIREFGCPSFEFEKDGSVQVHEDLCIGDGSCLATCPAHALVRGKKEGAK